MGLSPSVICSVGPNGGRAVTKNWLKRVSSSTINFLLNNVCLFVSSFFKGFMLLAERVRNEAEKKVIKQILERHLPRAEIQEEVMYSRCMESEEFLRVRSLSEFSHIVWTKSMLRLFTLLSKCLRHKEPLLLVGETGCGKTSICQVFVGSNIVHSPLTHTASPPLSCRYTQLC